MSTPSIGSLNNLKSEQVAGEFNAYAEKLGWNRQLTLSGKLYANAGNYLRDTRKAIKEIAKNGLGITCPRSDASIAKKKSRHPELVENFIPDEWRSKLDAEATLQSWTRLPASLRLCHALLALPKESPLFHALCSQPRKIGLRLPVVAKQATALLNQALAEGHTSLARLLLHWGALIDMRRRDQGIELPSLHPPSQSDLLEIIAESLQLPEHTDIRKGLPTTIQEIPSDAAGWTPLHHAIHARRWDLNANQDPGVKIDVEGYTAANIGKLTAFRFQTDDVENLRALDRALLSSYTLYSAQMGDLVLLQRLVEKDETLLAVHDENGRYPIHLAVFNGHMKVVEWLLRHPGQLYARSADGFTCAHEAALRGHLEMLKMLVNRDMNLLLTCSKDGRLPIHLANDYYQNHVVKWIQQEHPHQNAQAPATQVILNFLPQAKPVAPKQFASPASRQPKVAGKERRQEVTVWEPAQAKLATPSMPLSITENDSNLGPISRKFYNPRNKKMHSKFIAVNFDLPKASWQPQGVRPMAATIFTQAPKQPAGRIAPLPVGTDDESTTDEESTYVPVCPDEDSDALPETKRAKKQ